MNLVRIYIFSEKLEKSGRRKDLGEIDIKTIPDLEQAEQKGVPLLPSSDT